MVSFVANFGSTSALFLGSPGILCDLARAILLANGQSPVVARPVNPPAGPEEPPKLIDRRRLPPERLAAYREVRALGERGPRGTVAAELARQTLKEGKA